MEKFSSFLKNKKILFFVFLFLVTVAVIVPQVTFASWYNPLSWGNAIGSALMNAVTTAVLGIPLIATAVLADLAGLVLQAILYVVIHGTSYTNSPAVQVGWPIVRNIANMMIVLGFVVIGIATALRIREYEAKQLLVKLIIVALLINFSLLLCGMMIDATNILTSYFFTQAGNGVVSNLFPSLSNMVNVLSHIVGTNWMAFAAEVVSLICFNFISFFVFLLYALMLLCRIIALWMLVILSPLAFVCYVFPATKKVWQQWWTNFFQWCIIGVPMGLFYFIGAKMLNQVGLIDPANMGVGTLVNGVPSASAMITVLTNSISLLTPSLFLVVGFMVSLQFSAMGASSIMNFANKNKGKIMGGGLNVLRKATGAAGEKVGQAGAALQGSNNAAIRGVGNMFSLSAKGAGAFATSGQRTQAVKSAFGRGLERIGAVPVGTQAVADQARVDSAAKTATAAYNSGNAASMAKIEDDAVNGSGTQKAAAIQALTNLKKLHTVKGFQDTAGNVDYDKLNTAFVAAEGAGMSREVRKNAQDAMPSFAAKNKDTIAELTGKMNPTTGLWEGGKIDPSTGVRFTAAAAPREAVRKANANLSPSKVGDLTPPQMNEDFGQDVDNKTFNNASRYFTTDTIAHLKKMAEPGGKFVQRHSDLMAQESAARAAGDAVKADELLKQVDNIARNTYDARRL